MEYTVDRLARLSGVSARTLRYYDQIDLLKPARISSSGYRIYGREEVDRLQQILFFRELGLSLDEIRCFLDAQDFDALRALDRHREQLLERRAQLDRLIAGVEKTIRAAKGEITMSDEEKFESFKQKLINENESAYGSEIRQLYGEETVEQSNRKFMQLTRDEFDEANRLADEIIQTLLEARKTGDPAGETAQRAAALHRRWLSYYWSTYTSEAHAGVARMYVSDPRFTAYYDRYQPGLAAFLCEAVLIYTGQGK